MAESNRDEIAKLESMYAANPEGRVFTHLAEAYRKAGELHRAQQVLDEGLQRHQDSASGYVVLGRVLQDTGDQLAATEAFGRVLQLDPENRVALRAMGDLSRAAGRPEQALTYLEQLAALDPSDDALEGLVAEIKSELPPPPPPPAVSEIQLEPVSPYVMPQEPPQFTPADFPQDLTSLDLSGFSSGDASAQTEATGLPPWGGRSAEPAPPPWDQPTLAQPEAAPQPAPSFSRMPSLEDFGIPGADLPSEPPPPVEGLETVEPMGEVAPLEGLESADEQTGALPPITGYETSAPADTTFAEISGPFDVGATEDEGTFTAPFGEPASGEMVTETMAELYRSQGHLVQAAEVYRALLRDRPGDEQLERKLLEVELAILSPEPAGEPTAEPALEGEAQWAGEGPTTTGEAPALPEDVAGMPAEAATVAEDVPGWATEEAKVEEPPSEALPEAQPAPGELAPAEWSAPEPVEQAWTAPEPVEQQWSAPEPVEQAWTGEPVQEAAVPEASAPEEAWSAPVAEAAEALVPEPAAPEWAEAAAALAEPAASAPAEPVAEAALPAEAEPVGGEALPAAAEVADAAVGATEQVWVAGGDVATQDVTPYAWESSAAEEAKGPPVAGYLRSLLDWHRSASAEETGAGVPPGAAEPPSWSEPWAEAPRAPGSEPTESPAAQPAGPTWADEAAAPAEPTWAEEAASPEPWAEQAPAPAAEPWAEEPAAPAAWEEPAAAPAEGQEPATAAPADDLSWLTGPDGIAPEQAEGAAQPASPQEAPGDDDDLEMFRAWLQSLKK